MLRNVLNQNLQKQEECETVTDRPSPEEIESIRKFVSDKAAIGNPNERKASIYVITSNRQLSRQVSVASQSVPLETYYCLLGYLNGKCLRRSLKLLLFVLYNVFLCFAIAVSWHRNPEVKVLLSLTMLAYGLILYYAVFRKWVTRPITRKLRRFHRDVNTTAFYSWFSTICWGTVFSAIAIFLVIDSAGNRLRLVSAMGLVLIICFGYVFSKNRRRVMWRPVLWGVLMQYLFGLITIRWRMGRRLLNFAERKMLTFFNFTEYGTQVVYGYLVSGQIADGPRQPSILVYEFLPVIIFVSLWLSVMYHFGIMQRVIIKVGWALDQTMGTTACESMAAAANVIFSGPEACLTIQPYLSVMTNSELHAVMTSGFSSIAGSFFVAYVQFGVHASDLVSASIMSAPAALAFSKLFYPETERSETRIWDIVIGKGDSNSFLEAAVKGAKNGMALLMKIVGNLVAFVSFINFVNFLPGWFGRLVGIQHLSLRWILSRFFLPLAYIIGVETEDCSLVAWLVGVNTVFANMAGYKIMGDMKKEKLLSPRSELIATYAICGFCNLSYIGVVLGTLSALVPQRRADLSSMVMRSVIAGTSACLMKAAIAGSLMLQTTKHE